MARDWEATLQRWVRPASDTEEQKRDRAVQAVTDALNSLTDVRALPLRVYPKGSYANNTNVRADSDVDVAVEYTSIFYFDFMFAVEGMTREDAGIEPPTQPYSPGQLKNDVERALVSAFGRRAVTRHNTALTVREQSNRLAADVVPCFSYRRYHARSWTGSLLYEKGAKLFPDEGSPIINWSQQHYDNGVAKNNVTGRRYKRMVRALKNLENEMCDRGIIKAAPSYFAECLVYNVPNPTFAHRTYVADMRAVLAYVFNNTMASMRPSRVLIQAIVLVVAGVYVVLFLIKGLPTSELLQPLGAATSAAGLSVLAFDHFLWRTPKLGRRISKRPDLRGTWRGTLSSHWEDPETRQRIAPDPEVYLVVRQTFWSVSANLITKESKSCSTTASIDDDRCGQNQLVAMYRNTPRAAVRHRSEVHHGSFKLDISGEPVTRLEGYYWTDRNTMGECDFDRRSKKTVESYTAAQALSYS